MIIAACSTDRGVAVGVRRHVSRLVLDCLEIVHEPSPNARACVAAAAAGIPPLGTVIHILRRNRTSIHFTTSTTTKIEKVTNADVSNTAYICSRLPRVRDGVVGDVGGVDDRGVMDVNRSSVPNPRKHPKHLRNAYIELRSTVILDVKTAPSSTNVFRLRLRLILKNSSNISQIRRGIAGGDGEPTTRTSAMSAAMAATTIPTTMAASLFVVRSTSNNADVLLWAPPRSWTLLRVLRPTSFLFRVRSVGRRVSRGGVGASGGTAVAATAVLVTVVTHPIRNIIPEHHAIGTPTPTTIIAFTTSMDSLIIATSCHVDGDVAISCTGCMPLFFSEISSIITGALVRRLSSLLRRVAVADVRHHILEGAAAAGRGGRAGGRGREG